jgi:hypothetical protein
VQPVSRQQKIGFLPGGLDGRVGGIIPDGLPEMAGAGCNRFDAIALFDAVFAAPHGLVLGARLIGWLDFEFFCFKKGHDINK